MHIEFLVEDISGKTALDIIIPKIIEPGVTYSVHSYKGIGRIPKNLNANRDPSKRILLENLPRLLSGFGKAFSGYGKDYQAAIIVVCDLDDKNLGDFLRELNDILNNCNPRPKTRFCIAIEEGESWFLGDIPAIKAAYPKAKDQLLRTYVNDSICGAWELLADVVTTEGSRGLSEKGWVVTGKYKSEWAKNISPHMNIEANLSSSFNHFRDTVRELTK